MKTLLKVKKKHKITFVFCLYKLYKQPPLTLVICLSHQINKRVPHTDKSDTHYWTVNNEVLKLCHYCQPYSQTVKWTGSVNAHSYCLHICLFFMKVYHPPLESTESHAAFRVCERGRHRGSASNLQSPQSQTEDRPRPATAEQGRGGQWPRGDTLLHQHTKTSQILFHFEALVATTRCQSCDKKKSNG